MLHQTLESASLRFDGERSVPRDGAWDASAALFSQGYEFGLKRFQRLGTDAFETRLMLDEVVFAMGEQAARLLYEPGRFTRRAALPPSTLLLLQDRGSVQQLDGAEHRHRKAMFLSLMSPGRLEALSAELERQFRRRAERWRNRARVVLLDELRSILTRTVCAWAGIQLPERQLRRRTRELGAMIEGAGSFGPRNWWGLAQRARTERWARRLIAETRQRERPATSTPLSVIAFHRDLDGRRLHAKIAAVELLNLLRPTVAVDRYIVYAALALHRHPEWHERLSGGDPAELDAFVHEVRRFHPFFPLVGGRVLSPFEWRGRRFREGEWMILDLYATNHDPRLWGDANVFRPERFLERAAGAYDLVPQGAGEHATSHRCAGEWATIELVKRATQLMTRAIRYRVPDQDLTIDLRRFPARPASGFVIENVRTAD